MASPTPKPLNRWPNGSRSCWLRRPQPPRRPNRPPRSQPNQPPRKADMANFTAADVKRLRELTGAGMLDCKNALAETDGAFDPAVAALRIKGAKDVGKRAERATAEGLVAAKGGALIELNSETDFVAKNAEFQKLAEEIVAAAAKSKAADVDALKAASISGGQATTTVEQAIAELSARIGEKLELRRVAFF